MNKLTDIMNTRSCRHSMTHRHHSLTCQYQDYIYSLNVPLKYVDIAPSKFGTSLSMSDRYKGKLHGSIIY
jgi:hypothetical protein